MCVCVQMTNRYQNTNKKRLKTINKFNKKQQQKLFTKTKRKRKMMCVPIEEKINIDVSTPCGFYLHNKRLSIGGIVLFIGYQMPIDTTRKAKLKRRRQHRLRHYKKATKNERSRVYQNRSDLNTIKCKQIGVRLYLLPLLSSSRDATRARSIE